MKSRALADHGAQDLLVCWQMLPVIKQKNKWIKEQYCASNFKLDGHLHRSGGLKLHAEGILYLQATIERTVASIGKSVNCYILKSVWQSKIKDFEVIIGTDALKQLVLILWTVQGMS